MNGIDLRRFDLNLLVVFDVLMSERSVSRAADRLGRTQSAVSHSLARLRQLLSDPLLQRGAKGMAPTPFALELAERARPLLLGLGRMLEPRTAFDPATSARVFRLAAPDFSVTLFTEVRNRLHGEAPGVALDWTRPHRASLLELLDGRVDAAIVPAELRLPQGLASEPAGALHWHCFGRRGHPAFGRWGAPAWSRWPHLAVGVGDDLESPVNRAAAKAGLKRVIGSWVPSFLAVAPLLASSDLLATLPMAAMTAMQRPFGLEARPVPFALEPLPHLLAWSAQREREPDMAWLLARLRPLVRQGFAAPGRPPVKTTTTSRRKSPL